MIEFFLVLMAARYGDAVVVIPARYPTEEACRAAGGAYTAAGNSSHRFACVPAPARQMCMRTVNGGEMGVSVPCDMVVGK